MDEQKVIELRYSLDGEALAQFRRRASTWIAIGAHENLVRAHAVARGDDGEVRLIVDEVLAEPGRADASLRAELAVGRPSIVVALDWGMQIAGAMQHATSVVPGFVHGGLQTRNVLIERATSAGAARRAKVTDVGMANGSLEHDLFDFGRLLIAMIGLRGAVPSEVGAILEGCAGKQRFRDWSELRAAIVEARAGIAQRLEKTRRELGPLIRRIAKAARGGDAARRAELEGVLERFERGGYYIAAAVRRICEGERDEAALTRDVDFIDAEILRGVLDELTVERTIDDPDEDELSEPMAALLARTAVAAGGNAKVREAVERELDALGERGARLRPVFHRIWDGERSASALTEGLDAFETSIIQVLIQVLVSEPSSTLNEKVRFDFAQLIRGVVLAGRGDLQLRTRMEQLLVGLEERDFHLTDPVRRIWSGERDTAALTHGLDATDAEIVRAILARVDSVEESDLPSEIVEDYEIVGPAMTGGFGVVYRCVELLTGRPVALKRFKPELFSDVAGRERFLNEGATWVSLAPHPNVVQAYGVKRVEASQEVFFKLELIAADGGRRESSLRAWLQQGRLSLRDSLLFAIQIVRGMKHACEMIRGLVHRDLKPENVLVGADRLPGTTINRVRVTDFGLAACIDGIDAGDAPAIDQPNTFAPLSHTRVGRGVAGTPMYMAPEQWAGKAAGAATDIYAFGCILQEMLTGAPAVAGSSLRDIERAHRSGDHGVLGSDVPETVREIVRRCLSVDPAQRWTSWPELELALENACRETLGQTPPPVVKSDPDRDERIGRGWALLSLGGSYFDVGNAKLARANFERVVEIGREEGVARLRSGGEAALGIVELRLGQPTEALAHLERALAPGEELDDRDRMSVLNLLGCTYRDLDDLERAAECFEQALALARKHQDRLVEGMCLGNYATTYAKRGDHAKAIELLNQVLAMSPADQNPARAATALASLGQSYAALKDRDRAIEALHQSVILLRQLANLHLGDTLIDLAHQLMLRGDHPRALEHAREAVEVMQRISSPRLQFAERIMQAAASAQAMVGLVVDATFAAPAARAGIEEVMGRTGYQDTLLFQAFRRIWDGERDLAALTAGLGEKESGVVAAILAGLSKPAEERLPAKTKQKIAKEFDRVIRASVAAARGDVRTRRRLQAELAEVEAKGFHLAAPLERIFDGERDRAALTANLDAVDGTIVALILEQLAKPAEDLGRERVAEIDQRYAPLIAAIAAGTRANTVQLAAIEKFLEQGESKGFRLTAPARRMWSGDRDRAALTHGLDDTDAAIIRRALELLEEAATAQDLNSRSDDPYLSRELDQARGVAEALSSFIAAAAAGATDVGTRARVEHALEDLLERGFEVRDAVHRIWSGERDVSALTADLDAEDAAIVRAVLEKVAA